MRSYRFKMKPVLSRALSKSTFIVLFLAPLFSFAQNPPKITSSVDSTTIKIGQQIHFKVEVEADTAAQVVFPEGQTFLPLEMVEAAPVDTIRNQDKFNLIKKYALTQFDSGSYTLPKQQIIINNKSYFTDSLKIVVRTVAVDTTKQKMFDIKPLVKVERNYDGWLLYPLYGLLVLAIVGVLLYWFVFRKKPLTELEKIALLPPYDRALVALKKLDESKYLIQSEYKKYYSELTNIMRSYLEEDVHIAALESTTNELIIKLEMLKDSGNLDINDETIKQFEKVLQTADLVKFAKFEPREPIIQTDRKIIEHTLVKTKEALPEPSEEELLADEEYLATLQRKKRRKKIILSAIAGILLMVFTAVGFVWYYGFNYIKDSVLGHPTKELLEGEWIASEYGYPAIYMETPKVLKRTTLPLPEEAKAMIKSNQAFSYGSIVGNFYILANSTTYLNYIKPDFQKAIDGSIAAMEAKGAKNIIVKQEEITTISGKKGIKVFGAMEIERPKTKKFTKGEYVLLNFAENGGFEQIIIVYKSGDTYAKQIVNRILNSIDFKEGT